MSALAQNVLFSMLVALAAFHLLVLTGVVPYKTIWGGKLKSKRQMFYTETFSVLISLALAAIVFLFKQRFLTPETLRYQPYIYFAMAAFFALSMLGNLLSAVRIERLFFAPLAMLLMLLCCYIGMEAL